jgi:hypothetical protein
MLSTSICGHQKWQFLVNKASTALSHRWMISSTDKQEPSLEFRTIASTFGLYRQRQRHQAQATLTQAPCLVPWPRHQPVTIEKCLNSKGLKNCKKQT